MSKLICCHVKQNCERYQLTELTRKDIKGVHVHRQEMLYLPQCVHCDSKVLILCFYDDNNRIIAEQKISVKHYFKLLKNARLIRGEVKNPHIEQRSNNFYLGCTVHGKYQKCWSNLSSMRIGFIPSLEESLSGFPQPHSVANHSISERQSDLVGSRP